MLTYTFFAIFLASSAFAPRPGAEFAVPFVVLPSGAWGTETCAACDGLCRGWTGRGEPVGVETVDMIDYLLRLVKR